MVKLISEKLTIVTGLADFWLWHPWYILNSPKMKNGREAVRFSKLYFPSLILLQ